MKRAARFAVGSVVYDKRRRTCHLYTYENGKRHSKLGKGFALDILASLTLGGYRSRNQEPEAMIARA